MRRLTPSPHSASTRSGATPQPSRLRRYRWRARRGRTGRHPRGDWRSIGGNRRVAQPRPRSLCHGRRLRSGRLPPSTWRASGQTGFNLARQLHAGRCSASARLRRQDKGARRAPLSLNSFTRDQRASGTSSSDRKTGRPRDRNVAASSSAPVDAPPIRRIASHRSVRLNDSADMIDP